MHLAQLVPEPAKHRVGARVSQQPRTRGAPWPRALRPQGGTPGRLSCRGRGGEGAPAWPARVPKPAPPGENVSCVTAPRPGVSKQKPNTSGWGPVRDVKFSRCTGPEEEEEEEPGGDWDPLGEAPARKGVRRAGSRGGLHLPCARLSCPRRPSRVRKCGLKGVLGRSAGKAR